MKLKLQNTFLSYFHIYDQIVIVLLDSKVFSIDVHEVKRQYPLPFARPFL